MDSGGYLLISSLTISVGLGISGIFPRIRKDWMEGLQRRIEELEGDVKRCREHELRYRERLDSAFEYIDWLQRNSVIKEGAKPPPRLLYNRGEDY